MGREVRRVPMGWEPPKDPCRFIHGPMSQPCPGWHYRPHYDESYREAVEKWEQGAAEWSAGTHESLAFNAVYHRKGGGQWGNRHIDGVPELIYADDGETILREVWFESIEQYTRDVSYAEAEGERPDPADRYRPDWPADAVMGYRLYETVSEGTPLSPAFATRELLAVWMGANEIWGHRYTYEQARAFVTKGWAPSFVMDGRGLRDGVTFIAETRAEQ